MAINVQEIRGNTSLVSPYAGPVGQIAVNTDDQSLHLQDGSTDGGWIVGGAPVNSQTGTTYTIAESDQGKLVTFSNSSAVAVALPAAGAATNFQNGAKVWLLNLGAGTVTVTPASGTINGGSTITLLTGQGALIVSNGTNYYAVKGTASTTGTVTSVGLTMPTQFSVSGSPVSTSGTFAVSWGSQNANYVFAGPTSGGSAAPTFRALVSADLPSGTVAAGSTLTSGTIPKASGAASLINSALTDSGSELAYTVSSNILFSAQASGSTLIGTNTNDNAAAGYVGEVIKSYIASGSAISLTSGTQANVTSIPLTAGDWYIYGNVAFAFPAGTSYTDLLAGFSTSSASVDLSLATCSYSRSPTSGIIHGSGYDLAMPTGGRRLSLSTNTTVYLIGYSVFTISTLGAYGFIEARRAR